MAAVERCRRSDGAAVAGGVAAARADSLGRRRCARRRRWPSPPVCCVTFLPKRCTSASCPEGRGGDAQRPLGVRTLLDARSEAQAVHGLEMRTELRFGSAAEELQRQLNEASDQMLILGVSDLGAAALSDFAPLFAAPSVVFDDGRVSPCKRKR